MSRSLDLALFGSNPMFDQPRTTGQLANRDPERFFQLARSSLEHRRWTGQGPLVSMLEDELRALHGSAHCISFANACFALMLVLRHVARPGTNEVLLPALTFRGLPHVVRWAGLVPRYADVDPLRHTLAPHSLASQLSERTSAVLAVDNVHALCEIDVLESLCRAANVPLVMDCVYALGGHYGSGPVGSRGVASVFSLHATKLINGFEGGYLVTSDDDLAQALRAQRDGSPDAAGTAPASSLDGRLNEVHAAMALSNLPHRQAIVADNAARLASYRWHFDDLPWVSFADYVHAPGNHGLVLLKVEPDAPCTRDQLVRILRAENALVRPYYPQALHQMLPQDDGFAAPSLPISETLAAAYIQMPVGDRVSEPDIAKMRNLFERLDQQRGPLALALRSPAR